MALHVGRIEAKTLDDLWFKANNLPDVYLLGNPIKEGKKWFWFYKPYDGFLESEMKNPLKMALEKAMEVKK